MNAIIFKNISWTGVTEGETNQGNCVASNDVFSELRPRSDWHHYKLLHHFSSVTNAAMQRYLETSLSLLHLPIHAHSPTDTHRHLMCTANFHNVLKDMRNYFKRLITITAFFILSCRLQRLLESSLTLSYLLIKHRIMAYRLPLWVCPHLKTLCKIIVCFWWRGEINTAAVSLCYMLYFHNDHMKVTDILGEHSLEVFPLRRIWLI